MPKWYNSDYAVRFPTNHFTVEGDKEFHWCYEGDCGPDKWGTVFEVGKDG